MCLKAKLFLTDIYTDTLKVQALITGQGDEKSVSLTAVISFRNIKIKMNIAVIFTVQNIVNAKVTVSVRAVCDGIILFGRLSSLYF